MQKTNEVERAGHHWYLIAGDEVSADQLEEFEMWQRVKTTIEEANDGLFRATMNLPAAAAHCGMTEKEMKHIFREYLKISCPRL